MRFYLLKLFRRIGSNNRGTSILELAFVAPVLGMLLVGIADLGRGYSEQFALQQAANRTLELAHLGTRDVNYDYLKPEAAAAAGVPETQVTLESWLECDGTRKTFSENCGPNEQIARYVTLTINSTFRPAFSSIVYPGARPDGTVPVSAKASLRVQ